MSVQPYKSLTISGKFYSEKEILDFAQDQIFKKSILPWEKNFYQFILDWLSDSETISIKTSGSTGEAKCMEVEKEKMVKSAQLTGQSFNLQKNDKALLCLPVDFIAGKMMIVRTFVLGLDLIPAEPTVDPFKNRVEFYDFAAMTPMQVYNTLNLENGYQKLNHVKNLIIGGGELNQALSHEIKKLKNNTYHTYGMTETLTHVAVKKLNGKNPDSNFKALPGIELSKDERDCLVISAPHLSDKNFVTNDIVYLKDNKSFRFIGRVDNVINTGGIKVSPELIEQKLNLVIKERFIISSIPDDQLGEKVVLIIEGNNKPLIDFTKIGLSKYEFPKQVYFLQRFPETDSGKVIRQEVIKSILKKT